MTAPQCEYCKCKSQNCLAQCPLTGFYFCNGKGSTTQSHIIHHLRTIQCEKINIPEWNPFHRVPLKCYVCNCENIFRLGFVRAQDGSIYVTCRSPCQFDDILKEKGVDNNSFLSIVQNNEIYQDLIGIPTAEEYTKVPMSRVMAVRDKMTALLGQTNPQLAYSGLQAACLQYDSVDDYSRVMESFVDAEQAAAMHQEGDRRFGGITFEWIDEYTVQFKSQPQLFKLTSLGSSIKFKSHRGEQEEVGCVYMKSNNMTIMVHFERASSFYGQGTGINIIPIVSDVPFKRQKEALRAINGRHPPLHGLILDMFLGCKEKLAHHNRVKGRKLPLIEPQVEGFPGLNESQQRAAKAAMQRRFTMIQGPPGTGKTTVIAAIAHSFVKNGIKPVLVCAQSNIAADFATMRISQTGVSVVRVLSNAREAIPSNIDEFTTRNKAIKKFGESFVAQLDSEDKQMRKKAIEKEKSIVMGSDVVCATCVSAGGARLNGVTFPVVIFDESGQCLDPDLLIGLTHNAEQAILVGDHKQLGPIVISRAAARARYDMPLMERLSLLEIRPEILKTQYRMHPAISAFSSKEFYNSLINDGIRTEDRVWPKQVIPWPNPTVPILFWNTFSREENYESALSYVNRVEATCIAMILENMHSNGVTPQDIGIITPYAGQQSYLIESLPFLCQGIEASWFDEIEIASVDAFQGREKNFIIFSCVRANTTNDLGFLKDARRLCVSLTRAKFGLICVGNADTFARNKIWSNFVTYCQSSGVFMEGETLDTLKPSGFTSLITEEAEQDDFDMDDDQIL